MLRIKQLLIAASLCSTLFALPVVAETTKEVCFSGVATIPNDDDNGVTTDISVGETGTISKIRLTQVNITHNHIGEISASLIHGSKTVHIGADPGVLALTSDQGCKGQDITNLTIADDGTKFIETDCLLAKPAYQSSVVHKPMGHFSDFNNYNVNNVNGTWSLKVADHHSFNTVPGSVTKWCLEYTRPTNTVITPTPAAGAINLGAAYYPAGVTQDIVIQSNSGDDFVIERVEFIGVSTEATGDFSGTINRELPTAAPIGSTITPSSAHTSEITLLPGHRYRFSAKCVPQGTGTRTATFQITTNLPSPNDVLSYPLSCDGQVGLLSTSDAAGNINMGSTPIAVGKTRAFTVTNSGNYSMTLNGGLSPANTDISIQSGPSFPFTLAAGETKTFTMQCNPSSAGSRDRTLTLKPNVSPSDIPSLAVAGNNYKFLCTGDGPVAKFTPAINSSNSFTNSFSSFSIGTAVAGISNASGKINIKNDNGATATASLSLSNGTIIDDTNNAFSLVTVFPPLTINKNSNADINITCKGTTLAVGTYTAKFTVDTNDTNVPTATFNLSCTVQAPKPVATLEPVATTPLNFNTVGSSGGEIAIKITNGASATKALKVTSEGFSAAAPHNNEAAFELLDASGVAIALNASISIGIGVNGSVKVKCKGDVPGDYSATLTLTTDDPTNPIITYPVSCSVAANNNHPLYSSVPAPSNTINFGNVQVDTPSSLQTIQVLEVGNATLKVDFDSISNPDFSIDASTTFPVTILDGGASAPINIKCKPSTYGVRTGILKLKATDTLNNPVVATNYPAPTYNLSCTGTKPVYSSTPAPSTTINVGTIAVGGSVTKTIDVTNTGDAATTLSVDTPTFGGAHPLDFTVSGLPISVAKGAAAKTMTVTCAPTGLGVRTATLEVATNDPLKSTVTYNLECTGQEAVGTVYSSAPAITKDASNNWTGEIDFGNVPINTPVQKTLTISESGTAVLNVGKPATASNFLVGDAAITVDDSLFNEPTAAIKPGFFISDGAAAKVINLTCQPTTEGARTAVLTLRNDDNDTSKRTVTYTLKCNGVKSAYSSAPAPASTLDCGSTPLLVGSNMTETITVTELGTKDLKLSAPSFSGANSGDFSIVSPTFPATIADGGATATTQDIKVKFTPSAAGTRVATLTFATDDPDKSTVSYNFSCQAIAPGYSSTPAASSTINCGSNTPVGFDHIETLTITETGDADLTVNSASFSGSSDFTVVSPTTFPLTIANGTAAQQIKVKFTPKAIGNRTATLNVVSNDPAQTTVAYNFNCPAVTPPGYSSSPAPSSTLNCAGTTTLTGMNYMETLNISETGDSDLVINSAILSGANASDFTIFSPALPTTIANGAAAQDLKIKFAPTGTGTRTATLTVNSNDSSHAAITYNLSCQAAAPPSPPITRTLTVAVNPSQGGMVSDNLGQIRCGKGTTACSGVFDLNTALNLAVTATTGYQFKNWTGDCATSSVILNVNKACTANFEAITTPVIPTEPSKPTDPTQPTDPKPVDPSKPTTPTQPVEPNQPSTPTTPTVPTTPEKPTTGTDYSVSVTTTGKGAGKVSSSEINCQNQQCNQTVAANTLITLVAQPVAGSTFLGWSGSCSGKTAIITVNITEHKQCVARFEPLASELEKEDDGLGDYCTGAGYTNIRCNARGAVIPDLNGKIEVDTDGYLSNGIVTKPLNNKGWVANLTIEDTGSLTGGIVTGSIVNHGEMSDFEFRGDLLSGGKLSGVIKNNAPNVCFTDSIIRGVIKNVELKENTRVLGGRLSGKIIGKAQQPARLNNVTLTGAITLQNVILEENVIIEQDVNFETARFTQVKLAPNVKISGGKIIGELRGDVTAPAQLSNVLLSAHTVVENVIFGEKVEIADEKTCGSQQLDDSDSQNSSATVSAILLTSDGKQQNSPTTFTPQLTTSRGKLENRSILSIQEATAMNLAINVTVQSEHLGKTADVLVVAQYQIAGKTTSYMKTAQGWQLWNGQLSDLQPLQSYEKLPPIFDISVFNGDLSQTAGEVQVYAGYRLQSGEVIFNGLNPLHFAISSPPESCSWTCGCR